MGGDGASIESEEASACGSCRQTTALARNLWRRYGRPAVKAANIQKRVGFLTFRHTYTTLLTENNEEVKVVREIANSLQVLERIGGDDGTRTRDLCRDSFAWIGFTTTYKTAGTAKVRGSRARHRILWVGLWVENCLRRWPLCPAFAFHVRWKWTVLWKSFRFAAIWELLGDRVADFPEEDLNEAALRRTHSRVAGQRWR